MINPIKALAARRVKQAANQSATPEERLRQVERAETRFKQASIVFYLVTLAGVVVLLVLSYNLQAQNNELLKAHTAEIESQNGLLADLNKNAKQETLQINDLQNHIDCVVSLFTQPNRASLVITDITGCKLSTSGSGTPSISFQAIPKQTTSTSTPKSSPKAQGAPTAGSTPPPTTKPSPKPVTVLGVSVCIPFTNICVDQ